MNDTQPVAMWCVRLSSSFSLNCYKHLLLPRCRCLLLRDWWQGQVLSYGKIWRVSCGKLGAKNCPSAQNPLRARETGGGQFCPCPFHPNPTPRRLSFCQMLSKFLETFRSRGLTLCLALGVGEWKRFMARGELSFWSSHSNYHARTGVRKSFFLSAC